VRLSCIDTPLLPTELLLLTLLLLGLSGAVMLLAFILLSRICRSVCFGVMPHSATSSANGDDTKTTMSWNSGVSDIQRPMCVYML
jgi:hypothetical protein